MQPRPILTTLLLLITLPAVAADEALISQARKTTNRHDAVNLIEDALLRNPKDLVYWSEYASALSKDNLEYFADRASRHSLLLFPNNPDLLIARARLSNHAEAVKALTQLAKIKGYEDRAAEYTDMRNAWITIPESEPWKTETHIQLVDHLLYSHNHKRAWRYIEGPRAPKTLTPELLARKAILLALDNKFDEALKTHAASGNLEPQRFADALLIQAKPDLALTILDQKKPTPDSRRLIALAKAQTKDIDGALEILVESDRSDQMLRLQILTLADRKQDAQLVTDELVNSVQLGMAHCASGTWFEHTLNGPRALIPHYQQALQNFRERAPDYTAEIERQFGNGDENRNRFSAYPWFADPTPAAKLADLEAGFAKAAENDHHARRALIDAYRRLDRFADAQKLLAGYPAVGYTRYTSSEHTEWATLKRHADARRASEKDFWNLASARPLIANLRDNRLTPPGTKSDTLLTQEQTLDALIRIGPAILEDVYAQLEPYSNSGKDRRPWISLIAQLGSEQDIPILIHTLAHITPDDPKRTAAAIENDRLTAAALEECLQKLTNTNPKGEDRLKTWSDWWTQNAPRITSP